MNGIFDLAKYPGVGHRAAADQNPIAAGFAKAIERLLNRGDVTTAGNRRAHILFDRANQIPIGLPAVALFFRAAMQGDVLSSACFGELCGFDCIYRVIVITGADLYGQGNRDGPFDLFENHFKPRIVFQQSRSAAVLYNFWGRAATVHVQNICADFFGHLRCHTHPFGLTAENLNRKGPLVFVETHLAFRFRIVARKTFDRNELRHSQTDAADLL